MRPERVLVAVGVGCLLIAVSAVLMGPASFPILPLVAFASGIGLLIVGLKRTRGRPSEPRTADTVHGARVVRIAFAVDATVAVAALVTAITVAVGDARGHAVFHLLTGIVALGLFSALGFFWHPRPGSGPAMIRGLVLSLLAVAAFGSFVESLGGAGYDAQNAERRLTALASLHGVGVYFGAFVMTGIPIGIVTALVVLLSHAAGGRRA